MGTGKGSLDYWAARVPVSRIVFELKGEIHEQVARDAFRVASAKMPGVFSLFYTSMHLSPARWLTNAGLWEFVKKGDYPMMGRMKLTPENVEKLLARKGSSNIFPLNKYATATAVPDLP